MAGCETRQEMLVLKQQGTIRWYVSPMPDSANVYQVGRFDGDEDYWKHGLELKDWVKVQKKGGLRFYLRSSQDFVYFSKTVARSIHLRLDQRQFANRGKRTKVTVSGPRKIPC